MALGAKGGRMTQQHLHAQLGDAVSGCKKRMFQRLKDGADLKTSIAQFMHELQQALSEIVNASPSKEDQP